MSDTLSDGAADRLRRIVDPGATPGADGVVRDAAVERGLVLEEQMRRVFGARRPPQGDRYEIREFLGEGAFGTVWGALDRTLGRDVALKTLKEGRGDRRSRFLREAQAAAKLSHPHLVAVHDVGEEEGRPFIVMERIRGEPLNRRLASAPWREAVRWIAGAARGLDHAHRHGVIHRDVKPGNILVTSGGVAKVGDFGLAHLVDADVALTRTGDLMGTPAYMAPEQIGGAGGAVSPRTDVYALGAVLYEAISGRPPHAGAEGAELLRRILEEPPAPLRGPVPPAVKAVCLRALEKDPARRHTDAGDFADQLERAAAGAAAGPRRAPRVLAFVAPLAAVLLMVPVVLHLEAGRRDRQVLDRAGIALDLARRRLRTGASREAALREMGDLPSLMADLNRRMDRAEYAHMEGKLRQVSGDWPGAEACYRRALAVNPRFVPAAYELARMLLSRACLAMLEWGADETAERRAEAQPLIAEALELAQRMSATGSGDPMDREAGAGLLAALRNDGPAAIVLAKAGIARFGSATEDFYWLLAVCERGAGRLEACDRALEIRPDRADLRILRAAFLGAAHADRALEDLDRAIELAPGLSAAYHVRARVWLGTGAFAQALADLDRARALDPRDAAVMLSRAEVLLAMKRTGEATVDARRAAELRPEWARCHYDLGCLLLAGVSSRPPAEAAAMGREARSCFDAALRLRPDHVAAWINRGNCHAALGELEAGLADLTEAIRLDPRSALARLNRASVRERLSQGDGAEADYEEALRLAPVDWPHRELARKRLELLRGRR